MRLGQTLAIMAREIAVACAPGIEWTAATDFVAALGAHTIRLAGHMPDGTVAVGTTGALPFDMDLVEGRIFRTAEAVALSWIEGAGQ
jgi:hypothetical protein